MRKTLILSITMVLGLASSNIFSQKELQVAAKQFELGIYHESLKTIQDIEKTQPLDARGLVIKGQSQNQLGDYYGAVASFNKARSISPTDYSFALAYANSLIRTGQYEASKAELSYLKNDQVVNHMMDYCDFGLNNISMKSSDQLAVQSRVANFGAIKINGEIYYNTFGTPLMDPVAQQTITGQMGFHLVKDDGKSGIGILKGIHNKMNIGNLSMGPNGTVVYTKNQPLCTSLVCRMRNSSIYIARLLNNNLEEEQSFIYNEIGVANIDPFLTTDGKSLYFASNRNGGFGGFDLYVSNFENGKWSTPLNLGASINTQGDEISPMKNGSQLYFASNWHFGLGGFDIFVEENNNINHVRGVNSFGDDYLPKLSGSQLIYTSNRTGLDGIYVHDLQLSKVSTPSRVEVVASNSPKEVVTSNNPYEGARLVSEGYTITTSNSKSYFVQLGAFGGSSQNFDKFSKASKYGDIYKVYSGQAVKIRIGWFDNESDARNVLAQIKKDGFPDAFVVGEVVSTSQVELIYSSGKSVNSKPKTDNNSVVNNPKSEPYTFEKLYKVRLASYEDPIWFDNSKVKDLGKIEQWSKGTWTIFVLGGYKSFEEAESARIKASNRGFANAEVVMDTGGILESLKKN